MSKQRIYRGGTQYHDHPAVAHPVPALHDGYWLHYHDEGGMVATGSDGEEAEDARYEAGYRDGANSLTADIRHQFDDAADTMDALLEFFRTITGEPDLAWPERAAKEEK